MGIAPSSVDILQRRYVKIMQQGSDRTAFKNTLYMYNAMREEGGRRLAVYGDRDVVKSVHCRQRQTIMIGS